MSKIREGIKKIYEDEYTEDTPKDTYIVLYGDYGSKDEESADRAIRTWFMKEKTDRGDCAIIAFTKEKAYTLIKWAYNNKEKIKEWHAKFDCPYKLDYLLNSIDTHYNGGIEGYKYFHEGMSGDQIDPFSFG